MARPKKDRTAEHAEALVQELVRRVGEEIARAAGEAAREQRRELASLRSELRSLSAQVEALSQKPVRPKTKLGRWVPGGPGRPPKDAAVRIATFADRAGRKRKTTRRRPADTDGA